MEEELWVKKQKEYPDFNIFIVRQMLEMFNLLRIVYAF